MSLSAGYANDAVATQGSFGRVHDSTPQSLAKLSLWNDTGTMNSEPVLPLNTAANSTDNRTRYPVMSFKSGFALVDNDRKLIREHAHQVREALFSCTTEAQVECSVAFARYLSYAGLNSDNYWLFLRLVMTNNPWVIDELLHDREPRLLFLPFGRSSS